MLVLVGYDDSLGQIRNRVHNRSRDLLGALDRVGVVRTDAVHAVDVDVHAEVRTHSVHNRLHLIDVRFGCADKHLSDHLAEVAAGSVDRHFVVHN